MKLPNVLQRTWVTFAIALALELAIALPFLSISPSSVRGVPGPTLLLVAVAAAVLLGPLLGLVLALVAAGLAVWLIKENVVATPLVWGLLGLGVGAVGRQLRDSRSLQDELQGEFQRGLVPVAPERLVRSVTVAGLYRPVTTLLLAGDFWGVLERDGRVAVLVGDVSGHGPAAAAISTHLRATWRALVLAGVDAPRVMRVLNETMIEERRRHAGDSLGDAYATVSIGFVDPASGTVHLLSAGHHPPFLVEGGGRVEELLVEPGPALGLLPAETEWESTVVALPSHPWSLVFYTDGLVEGLASPTTRERYGPERLGELLGRLEPPIAPEATERVVATIEEANGGPFRDDVLIFAVSSLPIPAPRAQGGLTERTS